MQHLKRRHIAIDVCPSPGTRMCQRIMVPGLCKRGGAPSLSSCASLSSKTPTRPRNTVAGLAASAQHSRNVSRKTRSADRSGQVRPDRLGSLDMSPSAPLRACSKVGVRASSGDVRVDLRRTLLRNSWKLRSARRHMRSRPSVCNARTPTTLCCSSPSSASRSGQVRPDQGGTHEIRLSASFHASRCGLPPKSEHRPMIIGWLVGGPPLHNSRKCLSVDRRVYSRPPRRMQGFVQEAHEAAKKETSQFRYVKVVAEAGWVRTLGLFGSKTRLMMGDSVVVSRECQALRNQGVLGLTQPNPHRRAMPIGSTVVQIRPRRDHVVAKWCRHARISRKIGFSGLGSTVGAMRTDRA